MTCCDCLGTEQLEALNEFISQRLAPMEVSTPHIESFRAWGRAADLGVVQLTNLWVRNAFVARRTRKLVASGPDHLKVIVQLNGTSCVSQGGREAVLAPGDFVLYDTSRPYQIVSTGSSRMRAVTFSRDALRLAPSQLERVATHPISGRHGLGLVVAQYLSNITRQVDAGGRSFSCHLADATLDLLAALFTERLDGSGESNISDGKIGLLFRVRAYIERRLGDPRLGVAEIAAAHHISIRSLQKLFETDGQTVTGWIRTRRIEHCRRDLANASLAGQSVGSIAGKWGLVDPAHFSRLFKSTYGLPPREYRAGALGLTSAGIGSNARAQVQQS
ncbi:helix-turn-helix domain-containing protein [Mycobacterium sherrisii]|uniref:HTH araC/xylS-type domain-containing protein n=1 Tax=Mycobacterium sherrisii TaxID=243061 RepID=A0A1E3SCJ6_9MYCO|nr:helix-turn-helix domain-containing protein [Mycobacterium sherrisii]MCV7031969.1 helix-turn-helix domain-containing protein [Mycobacterium sherrisii]ODQ99814.1 hypothetical protein BHQ21_24930 [Mycobacterium sherrisii]ORW76765.1 hypothetical protein AWC25_11575 [Mycobacterium sherrisii]